MKKFDTVVFDMDGTILNTLDDLKDAMNYILRSHGYPEKTLEECRRAVGNGARRFLADMLPQGEADPEFEALLKEYGVYYQGHSQIKTRPYDGIVALMEALNEKQIKMAVPVTLIVLASLLTGIGVFDKIAKHAGAGTLVPITGFSNAVTSPAVEFKNEGFILGVGAKMFTIAGPVIVYGTVASVVYGIIYWITTSF